MSPNADKISPGTLAIAVANTNSRIRTNGLSAREILTKRDSYTDAAINFDNKTISDFKYEQRIQNHASSEKSKAGGATTTPETLISVGDIVHIKADGSKHKAREFYLVMAVNYEMSTAVVQKFCGSTLREKKYRVKLNEIYLAATNFTSYRNKANEGEDGVIIEGNNPDNDLDNPTTPPLRRSTRISRPPEWLSTSEIQRSEEDT